MENAHKLPPVPAQAPNNDDDTWAIFWSSGTTGHPKGIQHTHLYLRHVIKRMQMDRLGIEAIMGSTCFFHFGGYITPMTICFKKYRFLFFAGDDLPDETCTDMLYKAIDKYRPPAFFAGSHHLVQMATAAPPNSDLKLDSVFAAFPMGSTVPPTLFDDLKKKLPSLAIVGNFYSMTEIGVTVAMSFDTQNLGGVSRGVSVKLVNPDTGVICGPNEVLKLS